MSSARIDGSKPAGGTTSVGSANAGSRKAVVRARMGIHLPGDCLNLSGIVTLHVVRAGRRVCVLMMAPAAERLPECGRHSACPPAECTPMRRHVECPPHSG